MSYQQLKYLVIVMSGIIILLSGIFVGLLLYKPAPSAITKLPAFGMEGLQHAELQPRAGQDIYAINLFASWCKPCAIEMPHLTVLSKHIAVYGIAFQDKRKDTQEFLAQNGNPFTQIGYDHGGLMVEALGAAGVPETFILNQEGQIIRRYRGVMNAATLDDILQLRADMAD